jgi:hypothetical protein
MTALGFGSQIVIDLPIGKVTDQLLADSLTWRDAASG